MCIYYFPEVAQAVVNQTPEEDGQFYTKAITMTKESKDVFKKQNFLLVKISQSAQ